MKAQLTRFLGIGVPPRATACPHCKIGIAPDSFVYYDGHRWLGCATFFCSIECLQLSDGKVEDKSHYRGEGYIMEWVGSGGS